MSSKTSFGSILWPTIKLNLYISWILTPTKRPRMVCTYFAFLFAYTVYVCVRHRKTSVCAGGERILSGSTVVSFIASRGEVKWIPSLTHFSWLFSFHISSLCKYGWRVYSLLSLSIFWGLGVCVCVCLVVFGSGGGRDDDWERLFFHQSLMTLSPHWLLRWFSFANVYRVLIDGCSIVV